MPDTTTRIGTLRERPLHASLKRWYAQPEDRIEAPVDGYVIDVVRDDLLIEVQTRGFSTMKQKVAALLASGHRVRVVHPIAIDRWIVNVDPDGDVVSRRRSPRHGSPADLASELVSFPELLGHPRFAVEVLLTVEEELRSLHPGRCWRRRGWATVERRLIAVKERLLLSSADDLVQLLPDGLPERFTTADVAAGLRRPRRLAQQLAYCLQRAGVIEAVAKRGRSTAFERRVAANQGLADGPPVAIGIATGSPSESRLEV